MSSENPEPPKSPKEYIEPKSVGPVSSTEDKIQKELKRKNCPMSMKCSRRVTSDYFNNICNTTKYVKCFFYNEHLGSTKTPFEWIVDMLPQEVESVL